MLRIGIITDELGWHSQRIAQALRNYGCEVFFASLPAYEFTNTPRWRRGGNLKTRAKTQAFTALDLFAQQAPRPDAIFVRSVPAGSLEQLTFYLTILHAWAEQGVVVYNNARMIERTVDKVMTSFSFASF